MKSKVFAVWLCAMLMMGTVAVIGVNGQEMAQGQSLFAPHVPIRINSNADFPSNVTGGDGSIGNPWIIANFDIDGTGVGYGLYIGNITDYFIVRNCSLNNSNGVGSQPYFPDGGIVLYNATNAKVYNCTMYNNGLYGAFVSYSNNVTISNCNASSNLEGVTFYNTNYSTIANCTIFDNADGVWFTQSTRYNTVINNTAVGGSSSGILLNHAQCRNNTIINNNVSYSDEGIMIEYSDNNTISGNIAHYCPGWDAIWVTHSLNTVITDNIINGTVSGISINYANFTYISNNSGLNNDVLIQIDNSNECDIIGNNASWCNQVGIYSGSPCNNNTISNNEAWNNTWHGIYWTGGKFCTISNNTACGNQQWGIYVSDGNNTLNNNTARYNTDGGFYISSSGNNITRNTASDNTGDGMRLMSGTSNTVRVNNITNNNGYGFYLSSVNGNTFYHNNIVNNANQAYDDGTNTWDDGYPSAGNYWNDYAGADAMYGPLQNIPGTDGIGDSPYTNIDGGTGAQDNYPWINEGGWLNQNCTANDDTNSTNEDTILSVVAPGILANDTDPDPTDVLTVVEVNGSLTGFQITLPSGAFLNQSANGSFTYNPNVAFHYLNASEYYVDNYTYMISDGNGSFDNATVFVNVTGVNDAPVANDDSYSTNEDTILNITVPGVLGNDTDQDSSDILTVSQVNGNPANVGVQFPLASGALLTAYSNGSFSYNPNGQFEGLAVGDSVPDSFTYTISDGHSGTDTATVTITITGVNDAPTDITISNNNINENLPSGTVVGSFTTFDDDVGSIFTYSLVAGAGDVDNAQFQIAGSQLRTNAVFDFETNNSYSIRVETDDGDGGTYAEAFIINVTDVNDAPIIITVDVTTTSEDALYSVDYNATEPDVGDTINWSLASNATTWLTIDSVTGVLSGTPNNSHVGSYWVNVSVSDGNGGLDWSNFTLTISNMALNILTADDTSANEDALYSVDYTSDDDGQGTITWSLVSNATWLSIIPGTGVLSGTPNNTHVGSYYVNVSVSDGNGGLDWTNFTLNVVNTNDPPVLGSIGNKAVNEGVQLAFTATASDVDAGDTWNFTLEAGAPAGAAITLGGDFTWTPSEAQGPGFWNITIRVTDNGGLFDNETIMITVGEVNLAPFLDPVGNKAVNEGTLLTFTAWANDTDVPANSLTFSLWPGAPAGVAITPGGNFTWTPTEAQGPGFYNITICVTDDGTPALNDTETIMITVGEVNLAPILDPIGNKAVNEEVLLTFKAWANDTDVPANSLTFSLWPGAPAGAGITPGGDFTWTPTEGQGPGIYSVTVVVTDNGIGFLNDTETITITVSEVNQAPVLGAVGNRNVDEQTPLTFIATATDVDLPANALAYSLWPGAPAGAGISAGGLFTWTPSEAQGPGVYQVTVVVTDNGVPALNDTETISITVNEVNSPPVANDDAKTLNEDSPATPIDVLANDNDADGNTIRVISITQGAHGNVTITGSGIGLTYRPAANYYGTDSFTYTISDGNGLNDTAAVSVTVNNTNDNPAAADDAVTVNEDSGSNIIYVLTNDNCQPDPSETLVVTAVTQGAHGTVSISGNGAWITYEPATNYFGADSFTYTISDGNNGTAIGTVSVNVVNINDQPIITTTDVTNAVEGDSYSVNYDATDIDQDTLTWSLATFADWLTIDSTTGLLSGTAEPGSFIVRVIVTDPNGGYTYNEFVLVVAQKDTDGDGTPDSSDVFPNDASETKDFDGDGIGDNADTDDDGDGAPDADDAFQFDAAETLDTDGDGLGNNADTDDDGDGVLDVNDPAPLDYTVWYTADNGWPFWWVLLLICIILAIGAVSLLVIKFLV